MTKLANAPLVEVIFELRWAESHSETPGVQAFTYGPNDTQFFPGQFRKAAESKGFSFLEQLGVVGPLPPFVAAYRFRRTPETWPCYQIGTGLFTANQINDGYDWEPYLEAVLEGLQILDQGHPDGLAGLHPFGVELRYIDGLTLGKDETHAQFMQDKLHLQFSVPPTLLQSANLDASRQHQEAVFGIRAGRPQGLLQVAVKPGTINGTAGFVATTVVRSTAVDCPNFSVDTLREWLEEAHHLQREAFLVLIRPAYMESFR